MLLRSLLFTFSLVVTLVAGQNTDTSRLKVGQRLELECLQRDDDGEAHTPPPKSPF
jgi:hypothetical protein